MFGVVGDRIGHRDLLAMMRARSSAARSPKRFSGYRPARESSATTEATMFPADASRCAILSQRYDRSAGVTAWVKNLLSGAGPSRASTVESIAASILRPSSGGEEGFSARAAARRISIASSGRSIFA